MIVIDAMLIGYRLVNLLSLVERKGKVHSVFSRVVNIEGLADNIVTIGVDSLHLPMHAYMIRLNTSDASIFTNARLSVGDIVIVNGQSININNRLLIKLNKAQIWAPDLSITNIASIELIRDLVSELLSLVELYASDKGFTSLLKILDMDNVFNLNKNVNLPGISSKAYSIILGLVESIAQGSRKDMCRHVCSLIGLGEGTTPSGDDFLSGLLVAFQWINRAIGLSPKLRKSVEYMIECVTRCWDKTTPISRQMLSRAIIGELNDFTHGLLKGILQGDPANALLGLEKVSRIGGTSGKDTLLGVLLAFILFFKYGLENNNTPNATVVTM